MVISDSEANIHGYSSGFYGVGHWVCTSWSGLIQRSVTIQGVGLWLTKGCAAI